MANEKIKHPDCNIEFLNKNFERHFKSQNNIKSYNIELKEFNELKEWARNNIYNFDQLKNLKSNLSNRKYDIYIYI